MKGSPSGGKLTGLMEYFFRESVKRFWSRFGFQPCEEEHFEEKAALVMNKTSDTKIMDLWQKLGA